MCQSCIDQQTPPDLASGDVVESGGFFRNLKKDHVAKRYANDDDENPVYGCKVHKKHWRYAEQQRGHLSVNLCSCIHTATCSIAVQPGGEDYFHVAVIDLQALNQCGMFPPLVAQYKPIEPSNRCHFEVFPRDGTILAWMTVMARLHEPFPPGKLPGTKQDKARALAECARYRACIVITRWVRCRDGTLG
jgi:hypothetical protein